MEIKSKKSYFFIQKNKTNFIEYLLCVFAVPLQGKIFDKKQKRLPTNCWLKELCLRKSVLVYKRWNIKTVFSENIYFIPKITVFVKRLHTLGIKNSASPEMSFDSHPFWVTFKFLHKNCTFLASPYFRFLSTSGEEQITGSSNLCALHRFRCIMWKLNFY